MSEAPAWHEKYPKPETQVLKSISKEDLLPRIEAGEQAGVDFLLIDLRRNDHEVSHQRTLSIVVDSCDREARYVALSTFLLRLCI